jgi:hypothetical protein
LTPWGNSTTVVPSNYNDLIAKGRIGADAIKNYKSWFSFYFILLTKFHFIKNP